VEQKKRSEKRKQIVQPAVKHTPDIKDKFYQGMAAQFSCPCSDPMLPERERKVKEMVASRLASCPRRASRIALTSEGQNTAPMRRRAFTEEDTKSEAQTQQGRRKSNLYTEITTDLYPLNLADSKPALLPHPSREPPRQPRVSKHRRAERAKAKAKKRSERRQAW
jgi:hypothetical protein